MYRQLLPSEFKHSWFETLQTYSQQLKHAIETIKNIYRSTEHTLMSVDLSDKQCSICFELLQGQSISCCFCAHYFHTQCIHKWLQKHETCPYCRSICKKINENEQLREALDVMDDNDLSAWNKCEPALIIEAIGMLKLYKRTTGTTYNSAFDSIVVQMRRQNIQGPLLIHEILHKIDNIKALLEALMSPWGRWLTKDILNLGDNNGETPLYIAVQQGDIEVVKILLTDDTEIYNTKLKEPMVIAYENNHEIFILLYRIWSLRMARKEKEFNDLQECFSRYIIDINQLNQ